MSHTKGIAFLLLVFCPVLTFAQDSTETKAKTESPGPAINPAGSATERFLLGWQYQYQRVEQPDFVLVTQPGNTQVLLPNPESHLNQHSFTYDFSQVFLTPAQTARVNSNLCPKESKGNDPAACLARGGGLSKRFLSGIKVIANISEHPVAVQGSILPTGYLYGGEVDFDPTKLFTTGTDWKAITSEKLNSNPCAPKETEALKCAKDLLRHRGLTGRNKLDAILSLMTPTFQYKRLTPFDFLKYAGTLIPSANTGGLNSWSIIIDARRLIPSPTSRLDAIAAADAIHPKVPAVVGTKLCGLIFKGGSLSIISVPNETSKESCLETANAIHAERYELGCNDGKNTALSQAQPVKSPDPKSELQSTEGAALSCWSTSDQKDGASKDSSPPS